MNEAQKKIIDVLAVYADRGVWRPLSALELGLLSGQPQDRAAAWARCHLRELLDAGRIDATDHGYVLRRDATA